MEQKWKIELNVMKETKKILKGLACSVAIGLALATGSAKATNYEIIKIERPLLGGINESHALDINNKNEIVGTYEVLSRVDPRVKKPFFNKDRLFYELITDFPGNFYGSAVAINDSGKILLYEEDRNSKEFKESYIAYPPLFHGQPLPGSVLELSPLEFKARAINTTARYKLKKMNSYIR